MCNNWVKITGNEDDINVFFKSFTKIESTYSIQKEKLVLGYVLDFDRIYPTPKRKDRKLIDDWHQWRIENWGTPWIEKVNLYSLEAKRTDNGVEYEMEFETKNNPPLGIYKKLNEHFKDTSLSIEARYQKVIVNLLKKKI